MPKRSLVVSMAVSAILLLAHQVMAVKVEIGNNKEFLVDGKLFFPVMQWLQDARDMDKSIAIGVNTFAGIWQQTTPKAAAYLDACNKKNVYAILAFDERVKAHPNLLGWIHGDEPDLHGIKPAQLLPDYVHIKTRDKDHPVFVTLSANFDKKEDGAKGWEVSVYKAYKDVADVIGFDTYPIYGSMRPDALWWVGSGIEELRKIVDDQLPTFEWIETSGGSRWVSPSHQRHPFPYEVRAEMYMAIVKGAKALGLFTHSWVAPEKIGNPAFQEKAKSDTPDYSTFAIPQANQDEIKKVTSQIKRLTPVIYSPSTPGKVSKKAGGWIETLVKESAGKTYIFAVNFERKAGKVVFSVNGLKRGTRITVDDESRDIEAGEGEFADEFSEHAVHIYTLDLHPRAHE